MGNVMSLMEIQAKYDAEWVLLADPDTSPALEIQGGKVLWHSKDRDEVDRKAVELRPKHSAIIYTGGLPKGTAVLL